MSERTFRNLEAMPRHRDGPSGIVHASARDTGSQPAPTGVGGGSSSSPGASGNPHHHRGLPHSGWFRRIVHFTDNTRFWVIVGTLATTFVFFYAYAGNRAAVGRNQETLEQHVAIVREQRQVLSHLCQTIQVLDSVYTQQIRVDNLLLQEKSLSVSVRNLIRDRIAITNSAHIELSDRRACQGIE